MLHMTPGAYQSLSALRAELSWLEREHPDKTHLIGVARSHLDVIRMAGSCDSLTLGPDGAMTYKRGGQVLMSIPARKTDPLV